MVRTQTTKITIHGNHFIERDNLCCKFLNSVRVLAIFVNRGEVECYFPKNAQGWQVMMKVSNNCQNFSANSLKIKIIDTMQLYSITPQFGLMSDTTLISLVGKNFINSDNLQCYYGAPRSIRAYYINSTLIQCTFPIQNVPGVIQLDLFLHGRKITEGDPLNFTLLDLSIQSINPSHGGVNGGTRVNVALNTGTKDMVSHCRFGDTFVRAFHQPSKLIEEIICVSPPSLFLGRVILELSTNGNDYTSSGFLFEYFWIQCFLQQTQ